MTQRGLLQFKYVHHATLKRKKLREAGGTNSPHKLKKRVRINKTTETELNPLHISLSKIYPLFNKKEIIRLRVRLERSNTRMPIIKRLNDLKAMDVVVHVATECIRMHHGLDTIGVAYCIIEELQRKNAFTDDPKTNIGIINSCIWLAAKHCRDPQKDDTTWWLTTEYYRSINKEKYYIGTNLLAECEMYVLQQVGFQLNRTTHCEFAMNTFCSVCAVLQVSGEMLYDAYMNGHTEQYEDNALVYILEIIMILCVASVAYAKFASFRKHPHSMGRHIVMMCLKTFLLSDVLSMFPLEHDMLLKLQPILVIFEQTCEKESPIVTMLNQFSDCTLRKYIKSIIGANRSYDSCSDRTRMDALLSLLRIMTRAKSFLL